MRMLLSLSEIWNAIVGRQATRPKQSTMSAEDDLQRQVDIARAEWQAAQQYFETVSDPELVDHAIFALEAAQRKYNYLFRQLQQRAQQRLSQEG